MSATIAFQPALRPALPTVYGPLDYRTQRALFERMDAILSASGLEGDFITAACIDQNIDLAKLSAKRQQRFARFSIICLRANIARSLLGLAHREFCARLADSPLLQWFVHVGDLAVVKVFAKSTSQRFESWVTVASMRRINDRLIALCAESPAPAAAVNADESSSSSSSSGSSESKSAPFSLAEPVDFSDAYFDTTALKAPIHFPTDWVLLGDAARTLIKATLCIRRAGLRQRMPQAPEEFLREMNKAAMAMSAQRRKKDSKRQRKAILRSMKKQIARIAAHARSHLEALRTRRCETSLSEGQAKQIERRLENILTQLPAAVKQAHERIIGGRQVANADKILSLYDRSVQVIVRGKASAEVEFGSKITLVEIRNGMVIDYCMHRENIADSNSVPASLERLPGSIAERIAALWGDRGTHSAANEKLLEKHDIKSGLCPRSPSELTRRMKEDPGMKAGLKRRGSTEARIAIFKNVFMGNPGKGRSFEAREKACGWCVLTHNLWVLARQPQAQAKTQRKSAKPNAQTWRVTVSGEKAAA
jgi:hypothetical protein